MIELLQRNATRMVLAGLALCAAFVVADLLVDTGGPMGWSVFVLGLLLVAVGSLFLHLLPGEDVGGDPIAVHSPVRGRWAAINSPATKVPSHGIRAYGQAYAVDLVAEPLDGPPRPEFGKAAGMAPPTDFPAYGQPVHAMVEGTVVKVSDRQRDHRSRTRWWAVVVMMFEATLREFRGAGGVIGNRVVIDAGGGVFALVAHLQQGSAKVTEGDHVRAGDVIGLCGNTGNSSEPHVHAQLMDRVNAAAAKGLPMTFLDVGMPTTGDHLEV